MAYDGIGVTCSDAELEFHLKRGPEPVCGMCPANGESYEKDIYHADFDIPDALRVERGGTIVRMT